MKAAYSTGITPVMSENKGKKPNKNKNKDNDKNFRKTLSNVNFMLLFLLHLPLGVLLTQ